MNVHKYIHFRQYGKRKVGVKALPIFRKLFYLPFQKIGEKCDETASL